MQQSCKLPPLLCEDCLPYKEIRLLYEIALIMSSPESFEKRAEKTLRKLNDYLKLEKCTLYKFDENKNELYVIASTGLTKFQEQMAIYKLGEGATGLAAKSKEPVIVENVHNNIIFLNKTGSRRSEDISYIAVPIILEDRLLGVLGANITINSKIDFDETIKILTVVSSILAQAKYVNMQMEEKDQKLKAVEDYYKEQQLVESNFGNIIGNSPKIQRVFEIIQKTASSKATILIRGETGTGKELVATAVHLNSPRKDKPFIKLNCAAIPESLLESELFGHEKGAFTDAKEMRKGRFELADGGTLFLDEIGDISLNLQAKLLRVLQEQEFSRVGGSKIIKVDVRIIAATHRNLEEMVKNGEFREDLFYRLNVIPIYLPPLRERGDDIRLLAIYFLEKFKKLHKKELILTPLAMQRLIEYPWPGNIRELENTIERIVLLADEGHVDQYFINGILPSLNIQQKSKQVLIEEHKMPKKNGLLTKDELLEIEKEAIIKALKECNGIQINAAKLLGMTNRQIGYKIKKYNISIDEIVKKQ